MAEDEKKEKKDEKKEKKDEDKVVIQVHMHCEACKEQVRQSLMGYAGVEGFEIDMKEQKLTVKGKIDAEKLFKTVKKKNKGRAIKILYPEPKKDGGKKDDKKKDEKKEPPDVTVVLKVHMHCKACIKEVWRAALDIEGVHFVQMEGEKVTIKGKELDPKKVCERVARISGRHAEIVPPKKDEKKEGGKEEKKEGSDKKEESKALKAATEYVYPPQYFSDENPNACKIM